MIKKFEKSFLTMFGIGYFTKIPGSLGSLVTCIIFYFIHKLSLVGEWFLPGVQMVLIYYLIFFIYIFFYSSYVINKYYKKNDAKEIVIDEFLGQSIPLMSYYYFLYNSNDFLSFIWIGGFFGTGHTSGFISWILISFLVFRFFDILKPYPINLIDQKMKNGFGVMLDDVLAGIFTTLVLYISISLWFN
tara:strand:+ start:42 stop:605 length:564 start_codon:yes stop_codon:yes gene_type:complete